MRKFAILLVALSPLVLASSGSGLTVEGEPPVDIPEEIEVRRRDGPDPRRSHRGWSEGRNRGWQDYGLNSSQQATSSEALPEPAGSASERRTPCRSK